MTIQNRQVSWCSWIEQSRELSNRLEYKWRCFEVWRSGEWELIEVINNPDFFRESVGIDWNVVFEVGKGGGNWWKWERKKGGESYSITVDKLVVWKESQRIWSCKASLPPNNVFPASFLFTLLKLLSPWRKDTFFEAPFSSTDPTTLKVHLLGPEP